MNSYVVAGGGLAGLTAANALASRGERCPFRNNPPSPVAAPVRGTNTAISLILALMRCITGGRAAQAFR